MSWPARYFDGKSAARREAIVSLLADSLVIRPDGGTDIRWPLEAVRWVDRPDAGGHARIACDDDPARLAVADPDFVSALRAAWPGIDRAAARRERHGRTAIVAVGGVAAIGALIYAAATYLPILAAPLVPAAVQRDIGQEAIGQIVSIFGALEKKKEGQRLCRDPKGRAAVARLVARLVPGNVPGKGIAVTVANLRVVNALAAPGGRLLVFRGLIDFAKTSEEFAGVLAHEIGHALHHHPTRGMIREIGLSATLGVLTGSAGGQGLAGTAANMLVRTSYTREAEREADDTAIDLMTRAGIDTGGMATLFDRFAATMPEFPEALQLFATHPRSAARARHIRDRGKAAGPAMPAADWRAIKGMCGKKG